MTAVIVLMVLRKNASSTPDSDKQQTYHMNMINDNKWQYLSLYSLQSFGTYEWLTGKLLTPEVAFPSLVLFHIFDKFLFEFFRNLSSVVSGYVCVKRLETFLLTTQMSGLESKNKVCIFI